MDRIDLIKRLIAIKAIWILNMMVCISYFVMFGWFGVYLYFYQPQETTAIIWTIVGTIVMGVMSVVYTNKFIECKKLLYFYMSEEVK